jgi:hypothetical protein
MTRRTDRHANTQTMPAVYGKPYVYQIPKPRGSPAETYGRGDRRGQPYVSPASKPCGYRVRYIIQGDRDTEMATLFWPPLYTDRHGEPCMANPIRGQIWPILHR